MGSNSSEKLQHRWETFRVQHDQKLQGLAKTALVVTEVEGVQI